VGDAYHPKGYAGAKVHGPETNLQQDDCQACHGQDLKGGDSKVDCDSCHQPGWRDDCTYCHGGDVDSTGAPPRDIDGETSPLLISFVAHSSHAGTNNHAPFECSTCHTEPSDVLSSGHVFDDTPGRAEVAFTSPLSSGAKYDFNGGCSNLYCHGNGRGDAGEAVDDGKAKKCGDCHPDVNSSSSAWATMSGEHKLHLEEGLVCADCHKSVVNPSQDIIAPERHVDGSVSHGFSESGLSANGSSCTGVCHSKIHLFTSW
jgi:predicted CxxxxCH...CXXCH cytochrome family protein